MSGTGAPRTGVVIIRVVGWEHPASLDDDVPLDPVRIAVAVLLIAIFAVCFMPVPISPIELIGGRRPESPPACRRRG